MATCKFLFRQKISISVQQDSLESLVLTHSGAWYRRVTCRKQVGESWQCIAGTVWVRCLFVGLGDGELRKPGQQGCSWQFSFLLERCGTTLQVQPRQALEAIQAQRFKVHPCEIEAAKVMVIGNRGLKWGQGIQADLSSNPRLPH